MSDARDHDPAVEAARRRATGERRRLRKHLREWREGPDLDKRIEGREGWLFIHNDSNDVLGQHAGRVRLSDADLRAWSAVLQARVALSEELGIAWLCTVVPDKEGVYAEYLPPEVEPAKRRPVHQFLDLAASVDAPVVYPLAELVAAKGDPPLYSRSGTHWNHRGAFVAYEATCRELRDRGIEVQTLSANSIAWRSFEHPREGTSVRARPREQRSRMVFDNRVFNHGRTFVFEREDGVGPRAVVFGESFAPHLLIFLKESFRRLVFVHTSTMPREILEHESPDVVLSYPTERFLVRVPSDSSAMRQISEEVRIKLEAHVVRPPGPYLSGIPGKGEAAAGVGLPWPDLVDPVG